MLSNQSIIFATQNRNKLLEVQAMLGNAFQLMTLSDVGITDELEENQLTLEGNALQKANYVYNLTGLACFADDTGLEVEALNGAPGVYSARYAGEERDALANMNRILRELNGIQNRNARFRTVIAWVDKQQEYCFEGIIKGIITTSQRGNAGFGYDPIFQPENQELTFAEMDLSTKNKLSHRARAFSTFKEWLGKR